MPGGCEGGRKGNTQLLTPNGSNLSHSRRVGQEGKGGGVQCPVFILHLSIACRWVGRERAYNCSSNLLLSVSNSISTRLNWEALDSSVIIYLISTCVFSRNRFYLQVGWLRREEGGGTK
jgi:hypothetical protein